MPGVTYAHPNILRLKGLEEDGWGFGSNRKCVSEPPETTYFMTFRGNCEHSGPSSVRADLSRVFQKPVKNVVYECSDCSKLGRGPALDRFAQLMSSTFAIVPHGDGRWSMRFSEIMGARAIPVIIADGMTLPFEQLIDWSHAAVWIEEAVVENAKSPEDLLNKLPQDASVILQLRRNICEIHDRFFRTHEHRVNGFLQSIMVYQRKRPTPAYLPPPSRCIHVHHAPPACKKTKGKGRRQR